jgi:hypothetical protein
MNFEELTSRLSKLVTDIDKQLKDFNEIIPYEHNQDAYSPRLVNMLLSTCSQIESFCKLIKNECNLPEPTSRNGGIRELLKKIDHNDVLSNMEWITSFYENFQPFDDIYDWWKKYNDIKHDMKTQILNVKYKHVLNAIVALHTLERLAYAKIQNNLNGRHLIDSNNWEKKSNQLWSTNHELFYTYTAPKTI